MAQAEPCWAGWFRPHCRELRGLGLVPLLDPVLMFASPPLWAREFLVSSPLPPPPWPSVSQCLLLGEGLWADRYKPVPFMGGHVAVLTPPRLFQASLSPSSPAPAQLSRASCGISGPGSWDLGQARIIFLLLFPISVVTVFTKPLVKTHGITRTAQE